MMFAPAALPAGPETAVTYKADCVTEETRFSTGDVVCAKDSNYDPRTRAIYWVNPDQAVVQIDPISSASDSSTRTVNQPGVWRIYLVGFDNESRGVVSFSVSDPQNPAVDLSVLKQVSGDSFTPGAVVSYTVRVTNNGPDDAASVTLTEQTPNNTTQMTGSPSQFSGPTFDCTPGSPTICTVSSLPAGASAGFTFFYQIDAGTPAGTVISNTATVTSTTAELHAADNEWTVQTVVSAGGGGTGTCSVACPDDISTPANTVDQDNNPGAIVHFSPPSGNAECGTIVVDHCNDCFFPLGTTVVTATGTGDSCSFSVTVTPAGSAPTISCPANQSANADSNCSASINLGTATSTGSNVTVVGFRSDGQPVYTCDEFGNCTRNSSDAPFSAGATTITWYAYSHDVAGPYDAQSGDEESHRTGGATCTQTVTVNDVTPPNIAASDSSVSADASCQALVPDYSSTVSDNCACSGSDTSDACAGHPHFSYTQTPAAGTPVGLGPHTVHIESNDGSSNNGGAGNTATKDVTFTVNDTTAPAITCPANIVTSNDPGTCSATVNPGTATATDNCDTSPTIAGTRSDNQPLNSSYPKGTTIITWTATDDAGNTSSCTQSVTVNDTEAPTISCPANIVKGNDPGVCGAVVTYATPVGSDNCPGATTAQTGGLPSGSVFPVGVTVNTFQVTDASGNKTSCSFSVTVNDVENPVISCPSSQTLEPTCPSGAIANWTAPVGTDNCPGAVTTRTAGPAPGSTFAIGSTTTVTYTVNDAHGNSASCGFVVTVLTPQAVLQNLINQVSASSLSGTQKNGLLAKLNAALDAINSGQTNVACNKLSEFVNSVQTLVDHGNLTAAQGAAWILSANHVRNTIGCTNNPCS